MKIAIGCDHGAFEYKEEIKAMLMDNSHEVKDFGCYDTSAVDYPDIAAPLAKAVAAGEFERGILMCGTGIGVSIAANKINGVRCALVHDCFTAKVTREHNDSNVLAMGQRNMGIEVCKEITRIWLETPFSQIERHQRRIDKVKKLEEQ